MPDSGQYFSVAPVKVLDTRSGTGGVPVAPLAAGGTVTFQVVGVGQVPSTGVSDVYAVITAISPATGGCLQDYDSDLSNPGICTVSFEGGENVTTSDIVEVSSSGDISVTNSSSGTADVAVTVLGYYQDFTAPAAGDTYVPLRQSDIVDTRSGLGSPQAQVPSGGTLTVQVTGQGGVPSDAAGAALFIGAANATQAGWVSAYPAGGSSSSLSILSYSPDRTIHNLYFGPLSNSGQLTLVNQGPAPVDLMVGIQGYLVGPSESEAGAEYQDLPESRIVDTRDGTGGVPATPIPAGGSITFTAAGTDGMPSNGVASVDEIIAALNPTGNGYLSAYPAGSSDPQQPGVNFNTGDSGDSDMSAPLLSAVSPTGQETITNHSSGTVDVVVSARGYYLAATTPDAPASVSASVSGQTATISWQPPGSDGGARITGYTVTVGPDKGTATVSGSTLSATLTGLAHATADHFTVTASNAVGTSEAASYTPSGIISGTVLSPNGQPVSGSPITIYASDAPAGDPSGWTEPTIGTTTTDANGIWTFTVPAYSALPAAAQTLASNNGGYLNMAVTADAYATVGATQYTELGMAGSAAWVGTSSQPSGPATITSADATAMTMTVTPQQADLSANDTPANGESTWTYQNSPELTDGNGNMIGSQDPAETPPTDAYGYQNLDGPVNDGYSPYVAADGTDLSNVPATGGLSTSCSKPGETTMTYSYWIWKKDLATAVGEYHINWDGTGEIMYETGSTTNVGFMVSADDEHFGFSYYQSLYDSVTGSGGGVTNVAPYNAGILYLSVAYSKYKQVWWQTADPKPGPPPAGTTFCKTKWTIKEDGIASPPGTNTLTWTQPKSPASHKMWLNDDGISGFYNALPRSEKNKVPYGGDGFYYVKTGTGYTYTWAATIYGIGIQAETDHSTDTFQQDSWGTGCRTLDDITSRKDCLHWAWGSNEPAKVGDTPKIFSNY